MTVGWMPSWPRVPALAGAEWCSAWQDYLKGVVWTTVRVPAPVAVRLAVAGVAP